MHILKHSAIDMMARLQPAAEEHERVPETLADEIYIPGSSLRGCGVGRLHLTGGSGINSCQDGPDF